MSSGEQAYDFDYFLIGAGQANVPLGPKLVEDGHRVGLAERQHMGGSCVNFGCMPSKAVHASAKLAHQARLAKDWGIDLDPTAVRPILKDVLARARVWSGKAEQHITSEFAKRGVDVFAAHARLDGRHGNGFKIALDDNVGGQTVTARHVVLDPGSRTALPPIDGLEAVQNAGALITAETWLDQPTHHPRLLVLGGGYIGTEMAQFYARMGSRVTIVQVSEHLLDKEDADIAGTLQEWLAEEGLHIRVQTTAKQVETVAGEGFRMHFDHGEPVDFDGLFVATGRRPVTGDVGLHTVGLSANDDGAIDCDRFGETSVPGLFVTGDARGGPAFTHTAHDDHHILLGRFRGQRDPGGSDDRDARLVPWAVFTDPEIGRVGLSEKQCAEQGIDPLVIRVDMFSNDRARVIGEGRGVVKILVEKGDPEGKLLGAVILGHAAGELIHAFIMLMHLDRGLRSILDAIFIHPTLFEVIHQAVDKWHKQNS